MNRYPEYQATDVQWLDEVPSHWAVTKLKHAAWVNPTKGASDYDKESDDLATFLPMENVSEDGVIDTSLKRPISEVWSGFTYFEEGDAIVAKITPCFENGKGAHLRDLGAPVGFGSTEFHVLRPRDGVSDGRYLYYLTHSHVFRGTGEAFMTGSAGQKRVPTDFVEEFVTALPPLDEQRQLADYLDRKTAEVDRLVEKKQTLITRLGELRAAVVNRAVTEGLDPVASMKDPSVEWLGEVPQHWEIMRLGYACDLKMGFPFSSSGYTEKKSDVRLLRGINVAPGLIKWSDVKRWSRDEYDDFPDYHLCVGDIVLGMDRTMVGDGIRVARITQDDLPALLLQRVACLRPADRIRAGYLYLLLQSESFADYFKPLFTGISVPHLSPRQLGNFVVALPPLVEQDAIIEYVDAKLRAIDVACSKCARTIELAHELRASLISEVVTGKIDVRGTALVEAVEPREVQDVNPFTLWVLANYVLNRMASADHFGRITLVKVLFALQYEMRLRLTGKKYADPWQRWDFGPFNPKLVNALEASLDREGYWRKVQTDDDRQVRYEPKENASDPKGHFEKYWGDRRDEIDAVIDVFERVTSKGDAARRAEIVATLYGAWNDLLIAGEPFTDDDIVAEARENWHESKLQIERARWLKALDWMREHDFVPSGFGDPIVAREVEA